MDELPVPPVEGDSEEGSTGGREEPEDGSGDGLLANQHHPARQRPVLGDNNTTLRGNPVTQEISEAGSSRESAVQESASENCSSSTEAQYVGALEDQSNGEEGSNRAFFNADGRAGAQYMGVLDEDTSDGEETLYRGVFRGDRQNSTRAQYRRVPNEDQHNGMGTQYRRVRDEDQPSGTGVQCGRVPNANQCTVTGAQCRRVPDEDQRNRTGVQCGTIPNEDQHNGTGAQNRRAPQCNGTAQYRRVPVEDQHNVTRARYKRNTGSNYSKDSSEEEDQNGAQVRHEEGLQRDGGSAQADHHSSLTQVKAIANPSNREYRNYLLPSDASNAFSMHICSSNNNTCRCRHGDGNDSGNTETSPRYSIEQMS